MPKIEETASAIGWHKHGSRWLWGIASDEACAICDAADEWLSLETKREVELKRSLTDAANELRGRLADRGIVSRPGGKRERA